MSWTFANQFAHSHLFSTCRKLSFATNSNRVDGRLGASVPALFGLLFSNIFASYQFYLVRPLAGKLLFATSLWLAAAAALETDTWRLNPENSTTGQRAPLYPAKDDSTNGEKWKTTKFRWET